MVEKWMATPAGLPIIGNYAIFSMNVADFEGRFCAFDSVIEFYRLPLNFWREKWK